MIFELKPKSIGITKDQVWSAWKRIKQGGKGVGVDNVTIEMIEQNPRKYLYPVWNRMASGSYIPPAVREVSIPKPNGKERLLGIPKLLSYYFVTVSCRNRFSFQIYGRISYCDLNDEDINRTER